jgi:ATP-dependent Clp protease ATP-binding subunit ClpA
MRSCRSAICRPTVVAMVIDKFILELELQLADRERPHPVRQRRAAWLAEKGYDKLYGARPMAA